MQEPKDKRKLEALNDLLKSHGEKIAPAQFQSSLGLLAIELILCKFPDNLSSSLIYNAFDDIHVIYQFFEELKNMEELC